MSSRSGSVIIRRGFVLRDDRSLGAVQETELRSYLTPTLAAAREILAEYGAHGDLRLLYEVDLRDRGLLLVESAQIVGDELLETLIVETETNFDDDTIEDRIVAEILRSAGVGP